MLTASAKENDNEPINIDPTNYYALCETQNQKMIGLLEDAAANNGKVYVSPAMFSWDWVKDPENGFIHVNSFVPTHLAIVDKPAYDPEIAYIKKEVCKKDGLSCYYQLLEGSDLENLNKDSSQSDNMSSSSNAAGTGIGSPPGNLEAYLKSQYSLEVVDQKNIPAEEIVKNLNNYIIIDKNKVSANNTNPNPNPVTNNNNNNGGTVPITNYTNNNTNAEIEAEKEKEKEKQKEKEKSKEKNKDKENSNSNFTLEDVQKLLVEQEERILNKFKEKETKAERESILGSYLENDKLKAVKDKVDQEKLTKTRDLYSTLPLDNNQLRTLLDNSIYNPKYANSDVYLSALAISEANREIQNDIKPNANSETNKVQQPTLQPKANAVTTTKTTENVTSNVPITSIPPKSIPNLNNYGTEFKSSAEATTNKYNDNFKGKYSRSLEGSNSSNKEYRPVPITGQTVPKRFQKFIN